MYRKKEKNIRKYDIINIDNNTTETNSIINFELTYSFRSLYSDMDASISYISENNCEIDIYCHYNGAIFEFKNKQFEDSILPLLTFVTLDLFYDKIKEKKKLNDELFQDFIRAKFLYAVLISSTEKEGIKKGATLEEIDSFLFHRKFYSLKYSLKEYFKELKELQKKYNVFIYTCNCGENFFEYQLYSPKHAILCSRCKLKYMKKDFDNPEEYNHCIWEELIEDKLLQEININLFYPTDEGKSWLQQFYQKLLELDLD